MQEQENEKVSPEYLTGFNHGYELMRKLPDLADKLFAAVGGDDRGQGFKDGCEQMNLERVQERMKDRQASLDGERGSRSPQSDFGIEPGA